jgi:hypothetical protein
VEALLLEDTEHRFDHIGNDLWALRLLSHKLGDVIAADLPFDALLERFERLLCGERE